MSYLHISNLYKPEAQTIFLFKECFALEKLHGTSSSISWKRNPSNPTEYQLVFHSGGTPYNTFIKLFDHEKLKSNFTAMGILDRDITIYGESYGGSEQNMSHTYGKVPKFAAFEVKIGDVWLNVPKAEKVVTDLGLEFVYYSKVSTDIVALDAERDAPSMQAIRNGVSTWLPKGTEVDVETNSVVTEAYNGIVINPKIREGIVIRPLVEMTLNDGSRIISKHKRSEFRETKTPRTVDPEKLKVFEDAKTIADEWVTEMRLEHILQKIPDHSIEKMREIISAMVEDVNREGKDEFVPSEAVNKAIGKNTALLYKGYLNSRLKSHCSKPND